jgi:hypothetical protein
MGVINSYATTDNVANGFRTLTSEEAEICATLLEEAAVIIDGYAPNAPEDRKMVASCRMVRRALASMSSQGVPMGAMQGAMTAGPYTQSWTLGSGSSAGELYLSRLDKSLLGIGNRIGAHSPLEDEGVIIGD